MRIGLEGEKIVSSVLTKLSIPHEHTKWVRYEYGSGCDLWNEILRFFIEVKNLAGHYRVTREWCEHEVISRYPEDAKIKILVISFISALTNDARNLIESHGIKIIEIGEQVKEYSRTAYSSLIKKLYWLYIRVKRFLPVLQYKQNNGIENSYEKDIMVNWGPYSICMRGKPPPIRLKPCKITRWSEVNLGKR